MNSRLLAISIFLITFLVSAGVYTSFDRNIAIRKRVLVVGDSISLGWMLPLSYKLKSDYDIYRTTLTKDPGSWLDNGRNTTYTLKHLDEWLARYPKIKIILWNNGIWNATPPDYVTQDDRTNYGTPVGQYEDEIRKIAAKLKAASPRVIFLTTTQLHTGEQRSADTPNIKFNEIAKRVLPTLGVEVYDLWEFTIDHKDWHISPSDLHFNSLANETIADWLIPIIRKK